MQIMAPVRNMKVLISKEIQVLSILLMVLMMATYSAAHSIQVASGSRSDSNGSFKIALVPSVTQNGPVNISVNDTVVAANIDITKKNSLVIPITIPDNVQSGPIRICATLVIPSAAQICTNVQNMKQGEKNRVTLDLAKALAG
ncbi:MAG: hypothetical protein WAM42_17615 [Candidatus Nitrosopolaris sp.]